MKKHKHNINNLNNMKEVIDKDKYYKNKLEDVYVYIDPDYASRKVKCKVCKEEFYFINSKEELLKIINETMDETKEFGLEMIKLMTKFYYPGADHIHFHMENNICSCCYVKRPKTSFTTKCIVM